MFITKNCIFNSVLSPELQILTGIVYRYLHLNLTGINMHKRSSSKIYYSVSIISTTFYPAAPVRDLGSFSTLLFPLFWYLNTAVSIFEISLHGLHPLYSQPLALFCISSWHLQDCHRRLLTARCPYLFKSTLHRVFFLNAKFMISHLDFSHTAQLQKVPVLRIHSHLTGISTVLIIARRIWSYYSPSVASLYL